MALDVKENVNGDLRCDHTGLQEGELLRGQLQKRRHLCRRKIMRQPQLAEVGAECGEFISD